MISTTGKTPKMPNTNAEKIPLTYYYNRQGAQWPGAEPDNQKAVNLFQDLLLSLAGGCGQKVGLDHLAQLAVKTLTGIGGVD